MSAAALPQLLFKIPISIMLCTCSCLGAATGTVQHAVLCWKVCIDSQSPSLASTLRVELAFRR